MCMWVCVFLVSIRYLGLADSFLWFITAHISFVLYIDLSVLIKNKQRKKNTLITVTKASWTASKYQLNILNLNKICRAEKFFIHTITWACSHSQVKLFNRSCKCPLLAEANVPGCCVRKTGLSRWALGLLFCEQAYLHKPQWGFFFT